MDGLKQFLNATTQQALKVRVGGYLDKETDEAQLIERLKARYGIEQVYRFDIGKNCDGFSPLIRELLNYVDMGELAVSKLDEYPDNHYRMLKKKLSELYGVHPDWFLLGTGLDAIIDLVARAFLVDGDHTSCRYPISICMKKTPHDSALLLCRCSLRKRINTAGPPIQRLL